MILKLATIPELRAEALRATAELRAAGHTVEPVSLAISGNGRSGTAALECVSTGRADLAVIPLHRIREGERAAAVLRREEPGDVLVARGPGAPTLMTLPRASQVGVAGARRKALLRAHRPDLVPLALENGQSPPEAFAAGHVDAAIMGATEARRAGLEAHITELQDNKAWLPDPQQGAVAVVVSDGAHDVVRAVLEHDPTRAAVECEGGLATRMDAWQASLGAVAFPSGPWIRLWAMLVSPDGRRVVRGDLTGRSSEPQALAELMAEYLWARGAEEVLAR